MFVKVYLLFLDSDAVLAYLSKCCDQIPDQKQLKGASIYFDSKFERIHSVVRHGSRWLMGKEFNFHRTGCREQVGREVGL